MPGFIKVNGEQRPVAVPYVKVSGEWKPVAIGWIKVNGEWKIWHTAEIVDNFNRANNSVLGLASNDFTEWETLTGSWAISSNTAVAGTSAGPHLAAVQLYKATTDVTIDLDIFGGTGVGAAFWVLDATNWWATIPGRRTQNNPSYYYCADSSYSLNGTQCIKTETTGIIVTSPSSYTQPATTYNESYLYCDVGNLSGSSCLNTETRPATQTTTTTYSCPSGYSGPSSTNRCSTPRYRNYSTSYESVGCQSAGSCQASGTGVSASCTGTCYYENSYGGLSRGCNCSIGFTSCSCEPDGTLSCDNCSGNYIIFATASTSTTCSCPSGYTRSDCTCSRTVSTPALTGTRIVYGCPPASNYTVTLSGSTCTYTADAPYCPSGFSRLNDTTCTRTLYDSAVFVPASTSYPSVVRIQKSVGGVVTTEFENDIASDPLSIQLVVTGNNLNIKTYGLPGVAGAPYASLTYNLSNATKTTTVGLIKSGNQVTNQTNTVDNFRAE